MSSHTLEDASRAGEARRAHPPLHGIPRLSDRAVARPRVTDALVALIERRALVQVVAPAGSGKTTAVAQAAESLDRAVTWLTLEEWHRSPGRLLESLADALEEVAPGLRAAIFRSSADESEIATIAAGIGAFLHRSNVVLIVDDCHSVVGEAEAIEVLAALIRRRAPGLHVVLVGRTLLPLARLDLELLAPEAIVGDDLLTATGDEAADLLLAYQSTVDADEAIRATGGWIAGLLFESWDTRADGEASFDPLGDYLDREVKPRLAPDAWELLVAASVFDEVDTRRVTALGVDDPRLWLTSLRRAGLPAVWTPNGSWMRLHPRIREVLRGRLETGAATRRRSVLTAAACAYEEEGSLERALDLFLETGESAEAERLLPSVITLVLDRHDLALAERYLAASASDPEPSAIVLARLMLAFLRSSLTDGLAVVDRLAVEGRLTRLVAEEPTIGALACYFLVVERYEAALDTLHGIPPGRAADIARLMMSVAHDDPDAPIPPFAGDVLDMVLARALYHRGRLRELREGSTSWSDKSGVYELDPAPGDQATETSSSLLIRVLARFARAIELRDTPMAERCVSDLAPIAWYRALSEAELAIRLAHDPIRASASVDWLRAQPRSATAFCREVIDVWDGAARLLAGDPESAAEMLRAAVASMRRGDRTLALARGLVYLAEAEWRLGNEDASDQASNAAYEVAERQGSLRELLLSLADFPGVLSRRLDTEGRGESSWHALGRALVGAAGGARGRVVAPVVVRLREFGDPALVVVGRGVVRPRIRKSVELLSYLVARPRAEASREDVLAALWNGRGDEAARTYLRQALRHLRDALPDGVTVETAGNVLRVRGAVTSESLDLDVLLNEAARNPGSGRLGYLLEAIELADRGKFLEGSDDVRWVDERRSHIQSLLADARLDAAELLLNADRHLRALVLVDAVLDRDPLLERAWRLRMRTLGMLGDYDGVIAAYAACARALAEVALEPSGATTALARSLRR